MVDEEPGFHNYAPWANVVLGLLVFVLRYASPHGTYSVHWNLFLSGLAIMFAALAAAIAHGGGSSTNYWSAINVALGIWLIVSTKVIPSIAPVELGQTVLGAAIVVGALASLLTEIVMQRRLTLR